MTPSTPWRCACLSLPLSLIHILLCGLAEGACLEGRSGGLQAVEMAGALAVTALTVSDMTVMVGLGRETIAKMDDFSGLLLPAMAGSSSPEKSSILAMVSRPRPTITVMSLTVRAVTARAPAISTAWSPPDRPSRQAPSARPHSKMCIRDSGKDRQAHLHGVDGVKQGLLVLLHILVIGQRQPLHHGQQGDEVAVHPAGLAPDQLGHIAVSYTHLRPPPTVTAVSTQIPGRPMEVPTTRG